MPRETQRRWNTDNQSEAIAGLSGDNGATLPILQQADGERKDSTAHQDDVSTDVIDSHDSEAEEHGSSDSYENSEEHLPSDSSDGMNSTGNSPIKNFEDNASLSSSGDNVSDSEISDVDQFLYSGSDKTTDEAVLDVCKLYLKHHWTKGSLDDTLKLLSSTLPKDNNMPRSLYMLYKYVNASSAPCPEKLFYYCLSCFQLKSDLSEVCEHCNRNQSNVFFYFSIADQIRYLFEQNNLAEAIDDYREVRSRNVDPQVNYIGDILDGSEYCRIKEYANGPYDIILSWNTDGVSLSKSSHVKRYPVLSMICEVCPALRSYYMMVNALWVDPSAPPMKLFLKPFVDELRRIHHNGGVAWKHPKSGDILKSQVFAPLLIGDAPVRSDVLEVMRYNSIYGCEKCEQRAKKLPPREGEKRSCRRLVFSDNPAIERSAERMKLQGAYAMLRGKHVKGVKRDAIIEDIPLLDRSKCTLAEYMHCVCLGVTNHFTSKWFTQRGPWYIGDCFTDVDDFLLSV